MRPASHDNWENVCPQPKVVAVEEIGETLCWEEVDNTCQPSHTRDTRSPGLVFLNTWHPIPASPTGFSGHWPLLSTTKRLPFSEECAKKGSSRGEDVLGVLTTFLWSEGPKARRTVTADAWHYELKDARLEMARDMQRIRGGPIDSQEERRCFRRPLLLGTASAVGCECPKCNNKALGAERVPRVPGTP